MNASKTNITEKKPLQSIHKEFIAFIDTHQSVIMATISKEGIPEASYAPVLRMKGKFYIFVSELSNHTLNLLNTPKASLLFIQPETEAENLFARKRVTLKTSANHIERDAANWPDIMDALEQKFGEIIQILRSLADFHLFEFKALSASYVRGFAQAYTLEGDTLDEITHLKEGGHRKNKQQKDDDKR